MFQRSLSNPIPKLSLAEAAPYVANRKRPKALLHCRVEQGTAQHQALVLVKHQEAHEVSEYS